jgi:hypothetical protein
MRPACLTGRVANSEGRGKRTLPPYISLCPPPVCPRHGTVADHQSNRPLRARVTVKLPFSDRTDSVMGCMETVTLPPIRELIRLANGPASERAQLGPDVRALVWTLRRLARGKTQVYDLRFECEPGGSLSLFHTPRVPMLEPLLQIVRQGRVKRCAKRDCSDLFVRLGRQRFCSRRCANRARPRSLRRRVAQPIKPAVSPVRCKQCGGRVPPARRSYCSDRCAANWRARSYRARRAGRPGPVPRPQDPPLATPLVPLSETNGGPRIEPDFDEDAYDRHLKHVQGQLRHSGWSAWRRR